MDEQEWKLFEECQGSKDFWNEAYAIHRTLIRMGHEDHIDKHPNIMDGCSCAYNLFLVKKQERFGSVAEEGSASAF